MSLNNKIHLCYVNTEDLWHWLEENNLSAQNFALESEKWKKEISQKTNFFSDTELLLVNQDILLLKVFADNQANFLVKTYQPEHQIICQKLFRNNKNIILVTDRQWKEKKVNEKTFFLFKDKESAEKSLTNWLKEMGI